MAWRMFHPVAERLIQVMKDYLPTELDLIDAEESQAATPDVADADYYSYAKPVVVNLPCIRLEAVGTSELNAKSVRPKGFGSRIDAWYRFRIYIDAELVTADQDVETLQRWMHTYTSAICRVLFDKYEGLETSLDPTRFVSATEPDGAIIIGPTQFEENVAVRTGTVPVRVRRIEYRT